MAEEIPATFERRASDSTTDTEAYKVEIREGDTEAWLTVMGSLLVNYSSYGLINSFGFFQDYYQKDLFAHTSPTTIAFIGTLQIALMNSLATISGALCDLYGVKYLYIASGAGTSLALLSLSFITDQAFWQVFLLQGLAMGMTMAFGAQPALTVVGQHFKARRALAMGVVTGGCALGGLCFPIMFSKLLPVIGFAWTLRIAALKTILCYSIALCVSTSKNRKMAMSDAWRTLFDFKGFLDARYSVLCLGAWASQLGIWVPNYYIESYCAIVSPDTAIKGFFLPLINGTSLVGMILGGLMGDKFGRLNLLYPSSFSLSLLCALWLLATSLTHLILFVCLFGFCSGILVALVAPVVSQISPDEKIGARVGAFYSVVAVSSLIGSPVAGTMIKGTEREGYQGVIIYAGCTLMFGSVAMLVSRLLHDRNLRAKW